MPGALQLHSFHTCPLLPALGSLAVSVCFSPMILFLTLSDLQGSYNSAVYPGIGDDVAGLRQPSNQHRKGPKFLRAASPSALSCGTASAPEGPLSRGTAYSDAEVHVPHPGVVKVHLGDLAWPHQQIDRKEQ